VGQLEGSELSRAFRIVTDGLLREIRSVEPELAARLQEVLMELTDQFSLGRSR
jgi:hypothetical protein